MITHIQKWGNSLAVRIPSHLLKDLDLSLGSAVEIAMQDDHLVICKKEVTPSLDDLVDKINSGNIHNLELEDPPRGKEFW